MFSRMIAMLLLVGLVMGGVYGFKSFQNSMIKKYMGQMSKQPQTVSTTVAQMQEWNNSIEAVGSLRAVRGVDISSEVAGTVQAIYFQSGDWVEAGTLLVKLQADDDLAFLSSLKADAHLANLTYERDLMQFKQKAVPQSKIDLDEANLEKAQALIAEREAIIAKKFIRAPFSGRLGIISIDLGQYVSPGTQIVTLQELDPIYFDFYLPQQELPNIRLDQSVTLSTDLYPDKKFTGKIGAINSKVEQTSRNIQIRAILDNDNQELLPGMYGVVNIDIGNAQQYITLPQTAITYNPYGNTVFIAKATELDSEGNMQYVAEQRFVTVGATRGDQIAVLTGIQPGEAIVTAGQIKLQNGVALNINNTVTPSNDMNPKPQEY